jgi:threonyl-tRNA synthetase
MQEEAPGLVFWHPKGWVIWQQVEQYMRRVYQQHGYQEIRCPQILDRSLWEKSGHWENYKDNMFTTESEKRDYALKPMNCPGHVQVFNSDLRSYRDLPLRYGEFGACHRNEASGALHGIMRVRGFTQDDGHIFCTEEQIQPECADFITLLINVYKDFGFHDVIYRLSTRPEKRVGSDEVWDIAEKALADALNAAGVPWEENPGEGAFYGPKIEFSLKDSIGRVWQCGTMQVDFSMPQRLGAEYVAEDNSRKTPVMLHRAIVGSMERFIGILLENHAGAMPLWLAPVQVVAMNVTEHQEGYVQSVIEQLKGAGIRVQADLRNEKISYKIREHSLQKVPYQLVLGDKELQANTVTARVSDRKGGGENLAPTPVADFILRVKEEIAQRK